MSHETGGKWFRMLLEKVGDSVGNQNQSADGDSDGKNMKNGVK